jgi:putative CRISPR-associated protein (TIGR02619 family)
MAKPRFVLSPCGTSVLTNVASIEERRLLTRHANAHAPEDVPVEERQQLEAMIQRAQQRLDVADLDQAVRQSAELNGLIKLCDRRLEAGPDVHQLLCTDTWLGESSSSLIAAWLRSRQCTVAVRRQSDLQTARLDAFQLALSELVKWCAEDVAGYRASGFRVIFNLTGGFKSIQGFLQVLATFHADETVYIFENAADLLRIPHLPVQMAVERSLRDHLSAFRRLSLGLPVDGVAGIPEILLMQLDGQCTLSPWGDLVWSQSKKALYSEALHPAPSHQLRYSQSFVRSTEGLPADRITLLNERIDQLSRHLEGDRSYNPASLDFKPLRNSPLPLSSHEADAWADQDAKRLFGHFEQEVFVIDALAKGLH